MSKKPRTEEEVVAQSLLERSAPGTRKDERIIEAWREEGDSVEEVAVKWKALQLKRREKANAPPGPPPPPTSLYETAWKGLKAGVGAVADFGHAVAGGAAEAVFGPVDQRIKTMKGELAQQDAILAEGHKPYLHRPERPEDWLPGLKARDLRRGIERVKGTQEAMEGGASGQVGSILGNLGMGLISPGARGAQQITAPARPAAINLGGGLSDILRGRQRIRPIAHPGTPQPPPLVEGLAGMARPAYRAAAEGAGALVDVGVNASHSPEKTGRQLVDEGLLALLMALPAGAAAAKVGGELRDTRGQTGKYVKALKDGETFLASPEAKKLDKGITGIGQVGFDEGERMGAHTAGRLQSSLDTLKANENAIPGRDVDVDVSPVQSDLDSSVTRFSNQRAHRPDVEREIEGIKKNLQREVSTPIKRTEDVAGDFTGYEEAGPPAVYPYATPADLLAQRRIARQQADFGTPQTPENAPFREIYGTLSESTHSPDLPDNIGGQFKAMDEQFSSDMEKLSEANELILGRDDPRAITDSVRASKAGAAKLTNALMDTKAGGAASRLLERIKQLGPVYADAVQRVEAKIAWNATRFGAPKVFGHSGKWYLQVFTQNMDAHLARHVEPLTRMTGLQAGLAGKMSPLIRDPLEAWINGKKLQTEEEER